MNARAPAALLSVIILVAAAGHAQALLTLELGYSNPGARSLGFGGAFVALADDATAAYANPAGLVQLARPEISIEGRSWSYSTPYVFSGRASGSPTGIGIDTNPDLLWKDSNTDLDGLSFLSYVHPFDKWSLAFYRHQLARFVSAFATNGVFAEGSTYLGTDRWIDRPGSTDLSVVSWGLAAALRISDSLNLGITFTNLQVDLDLETNAYLPDQDTPGSFFSASSYLPERLAWHTSTQVHGSNFGLALGILWQTTKLWSVGGFVRSGFDASARWDGWPGPAHQPEHPSEWHFTGNWSFPSVAGLGCAYHSPDGRVTISFEWDHVAYSTIAEDDPDEAAPNANELHLGGEYAFLRRRPVLAIRFGVWLDPDHRIRATQGGDLFRAVLSPGADDLHYAVGFGAAFDRFQIDIGADFSDLRDMVSISAIFSF